MDVRQIPLVVRFLIVLALTTVLAVLLHADWTLVLVGTGLMVACRYGLHYGRPGYWHARRMQRAFRAGDEAFKRADVPTAERYYLEAIEWAEALGRKRDRNVGLALARLGSLYRQMGRYADAEPVLRRAFLHVEEALLAHDSARLLVMNDLLVVTINRGHFAEAEPLAHELFRIYRQIRPPHDSLLPVTLHNLALAQKGQKKYAEAEATLTQARALMTGTNTTGHDFDGWLFENLADLYRRQGRLAEAEPLARQALARQLELCGGTEHFTQARCLSTLAEICRLLGKREEAEALCLRCLTLVETAFDPDHPDLANSLTTLARLRAALGQHAEAEELYRRGLSVLDRAVIPEHPDRLARLEEYRDLLRQRGRDAEAAAWQSGVKSMPVETGIRPGKSADSRMTRD